ncbi:MAG: type I-C CRISPR-associated protein Cas8c/Csd1 [Desulfohalobiaceae bacterium]|nr:type I-C CRISPR-associated protein Cas8c/Csd1 [Desulfohalobiaceae bacterium]
MMLQALTSYYQRLLEDPEIDVPEPGFSKENIHFELVISASGELLQVNNIQLPPQKGRNLVARKMSVPKDKGRTSAIHPYFLWDKTKYVLGADGASEPQIHKKHFEAFRARQREVVGDTRDEGILAVLAFLDQWNPEQACEFSLWQEMAGLNVVFRLDGELGYVHERPEARQAWLDYFHSGTEENGVCLATGERAPIAKLHPAIKGVRGAQPSGAYLVSFNMDAFSSYGKDQGYNAPVSQKAAFAYATTLNHLLRQDSQQKVQVGDATTVFWSERPTKMEEFFAAVMGGQVEQASKEPHDTGVIKDLRDLLNAVKKKQEPPRWEDDPDTPFYILGLSGNASRLAVRFWHVSSVGRMARNLARHFSDLQIERRYPGDPEYPSVRRLLLETAALRRADNISPILAGELMRAIITGGEYPRSLMAQLLTRIRAENDVSTFKAALLKAILLRQARNHNISREVSMSLDTQATDKGYRLGRLFAVLEKVQQDAHGNTLNTTIRDRFYGAASATPRSIFPRLLSLSQHHLAKLRKDNEGYAVAADKRFQEVLDGIEDIPAHLNMQEQARFALGYYHQRNALYRKKEDRQPEPQEQA